MSHRISAAAVKKAGGGKVTIVGDQLGDRLHFWSEGDVVRLPNSHLGMRYTNGQFDLESGCSGQPACLDDLVKVNFGGLAWRTRSVTSSRCSKASPACRTRWRSSSRLHDGLPARQPRTRCARSGTMLGATTPRATS